MVGLVLSILAVAMTGNDKRKHKHKQSRALAQSCTTTNATTIVHPILKYKTDAGYRFSLHPEPVSFNPFFRDILSEIEVLKQK